MDYNQLIDWLKKCEGFSAKPYQDTAGIWTIGYGTNLQQGITEKQAELLLQCEVDSCELQLKNYDWYNMQPDGIKIALLNMCYNLGIYHLLGFKNMIQHLKEKNYEDAAYEALHSVWAIEVGQRAKDIAAMIEKGK